MKFKVGDNIQLKHAPTIYGTILELISITCHGGTQIGYKCRLFTMGEYNKTEVIHTMPTGTMLMEFELEHKTTSESTGSKRSWKT